MTYVEKREAILQAALKLIAERGLHNTPMSLVAKESGASAGTIYHHFTDKEDMIHALHHYVKTTFNHALVRGNSPELSREVAFQLMWLNAYHFYHTHQDESRFLDQYENSPYYHPQIPEGDMIEEEENLPELFRLMVDDAGQPVTKDLPIDALYEMTIGVAAHIAKHRRSGLPPLDEQTLQTIAHACYQAIMK